MIEIIYEFEIKKDEDYLLNELKKIYNIEIQYMFKQDETDKREINISPISKKTKPVNVKSQNILIEVYRINYS
jgi:hypothetical protein